MMRTHRCAEVSTSDVGNEVELCYQTFGDPDGEPLLLVMGLGGPMNWWDTDLCLMLAAAGFHVVRYDNRDTGRSTRTRSNFRRKIWSPASARMSCSAVDPSARIRVPRPASTSAASCGMSSQMPQAPSGTDASRYALKKSSSCTVTISFGWPLSA